MQSMGEENPLPFIRRKRPEIPHNLEHARAGDSLVATCGISTCLGQNCELHVWRRLIANPVLSDCSQATPKLAANHCARICMHGSLGRHWRQAGRHIGRQAGFRASQLAFFFPTPRTVRGIATPPPPPRESEKEIRAANCLWESATKAKTMTAFKRC